MAKQESEVIIIIRTNLCNIYIYIFTYIYTYNCVYRYMYTYTHISLKLTKVKVEKRRKLKNNSFKKNTNNLKIWKGNRKSTYLQV